MKRKVVKTSILGVLIWTTAFAVMLQGTLFAQTEQSITTTATVAPFGQYAPTITAGDQEVIEGESIDFEVLAADGNVSDIVTLKISSGQPDWLEILNNEDGNPARMSLRARPPEGTSGQFRVYFTANDDSPYSLSSNKHIEIVVNPANKVPVIVVEDQNAQVGLMLFFEVNVHDPDWQDTVTLTYSGKPAWLTASDNSPVTGNPMSINFMGTPDTPDMDTYTMDFTAVDDGTPLRIAQKSITITVTIRNDPPVFEEIRDTAVPARVKVEFSVNATDPDGNTLEYDAPDRPGGSDFSGQTFTWVPTEVDIGDHQVTFTVYDGVVTVSQTIIIHVQELRAPVFHPSLRHQYVRVGEFVSFAVIATDPNNDPITYSVTEPALPPGAGFDESTRTFEWIPTQTGEYKDILFHASDGVYTTTKSIWIFVDPSDAPRFDILLDQHVKVSETLVFEVNATDPDNDPLTYSVSNNPSGSNFAGQVFTWTPTVSDIGEHRDVTFRVSDGINTIEKPIWIFVRASGEPEIVPIGERRAIEGRLLSFKVEATDPNGDPLTYYASRLPIGSDFDSATQTFTWKPTVGQAGTYRDVRFSVTDGIHTVHNDIWIIVSKNDAPIIEGLYDLYVKTGELAQFAIPAHDPDGDIVTFRALNLPNGATFSGRTFSWVPAASQAGVYKDVMFEISDGSNIVTVGVWIFVSSANAPVISHIGDKYVTSGEIVRFTIFASDPDNDPLTYSASNLPPGATFDESAHEFIWTPGAAHVGTYSNVAFRVSDGILSDTKMIWIFVSAAGAPSIEYPGDQYIRTGELLEFSVTATDPDTPLSSLTYSASNMPYGATFEDQVFGWTPTADQAGTYPDVRFTVSDGINSDSKVIWIFVDPAGAPIFSQDISDIFTTVGNNIFFTVTATDPDGDDSSLVYSAVNTPPGSTFEDQTFRWEPQPEHVGAYKNVRLEVADPDNNIDTDIFWIIISENTPPQLEFIGTKVGAPSQPLQFTISASDADGDELEFEATNLPSGSVDFQDNDNNTATFTWTNPTPGTYNNVRFEVTDGTSTATENITIEIE